MKRFLILFFIIFSVSFAPAQSYERASLWQKEIDAFAEIDRRQTPPENAVLFVGSSSFRKWDNLRKDFPRLNVINRGFGGSHIEDVNFYFDQIVTPFQPRKIVFYAGENDVTAGKTPERVLADFQKFAELCRQKSPHSKLIFVSLKPSPARWELRDKFQKTNDLIKTEIAKTKGAKFVDVWTPMLNENGEPKPELFIGDKLHMNQKGYDIWREILIKYIG